MAPGPSREASHEAAAHPYPPPPGSWRGLITESGSPIEGSGHSGEKANLMWPQDRGLPEWLRICLQCGSPGFDPWVRKIPWRREWQPTPVFLPGESQGQRSLGGYSPWGGKELDTTKQLTLSLSRTGCLMEVTHPRSHT